MMRANLICSASVIALSAAQAVAKKRQPPEGMRDQGESDTRSGLVVKSYGQSNGDFPWGWL